VGEGRYRVEPTLRKTVFDDLPPSSHTVALTRYAPARRQRGASVQFTGIVKSYDADEGIGYIVREPDRHEILVRSSGLALGVDALYVGDRVAFDVDMGTNAQARNVMRT
jgi:cold shock CspA family protein